MTDETTGESRSREELRSLEDWPLIDAWGSGDRRAAAVFVERYSGLLLRFFRNKVRDSEDGSELVSETMLACVGAIPRVENRKQFRPFMFGVAMNVLRKYLRRKYKRQREIEDFDEVCVGEGDGGSPSGMLVRQAETRLLVRALRRIPLKFQIVLELQFFEEMTGPQISELLSVPLSTVYTNQSRGKERLNAKIKELSDDPALTQSTMMGIQTWAEDVRAQIPKGKS